MNSLQSLNNHLCAWIELEIRAQTELEVLLAEQEAAILAHDAQAVEEVLVRVQTALESATLRRLRRLELFADLADHWQVAASFMTLSSIVERLGPDAGRLPALRKELRAVTSGVVRRQRRMSKAVAAHRRVTRDVFEALFGGEDGGPLDCQGTLVNAEA